jgi:hypothetical protein
MKMRLENKGAVTLIAAAIATLIGLSLMIWNGW